MLLNSIFEEFQAQIDNYAKTQSQLSYYSATRLAASYLTVFPSNFERIKDTSIWSIAFETGEDIIDGHLNTISFGLVGDGRSKIKTIIEKINFNSTSPDPPASFYVEWRNAIRSHLATNFTLIDRNLTSLGLKLIVVSVLPSIREMNAMLARGFFPATITIEPLTMVDRINRVPINVYNHDVEFHLKTLVTLFSTTKPAEFKRFQRMLLKLAESNGNTRDITDPAEIANHLMFVLWHEFARREPVKHFEQTLKQSIDTLKTSAPTVEEQIKNFFLIFHRNALTQEGFESRPDAVDELILFFQELTFGDNFETLSYPLSYPPNMTNSIGEAGDLIRELLIDVQ